MDVYNKNIIHPMPYLLYVLKAGFKDAGFQLMGDILSDEHLLQRCIFTDKNYYTTGDQKLHKTQHVQGGSIFDRADSWGICWEVEKISSDRGAREIQNLFQSA